MLWQGVKNKKEEQEKVNVHRRINIPVFHPNHLPMSFYLSCDRGRLSLAVSFGVFVFGSVSHE